MEGFTLSGATVAKKAAKKRASKPRGEPKGMVVALRGSAAWKAWLDAFSDHCRQATTIVIDQALEQYAITKGFKPPPKR